MHRGNPRWYSYIALRCSLKKQNPSPASWEGFCLYKVLAMTYFRTGKTALSSAQRRFTVLFGMGRGGSNALWSPRIRQLSVPGWRMHTARLVNVQRYGGRSKELIRLLRAFAITHAFQVLGVTFQTIRLRRLFGLISHSIEAQLQSKLNVIESSLTGN